MSPKRYTVPYQRIIETPLTIVGEKVEEKQQFVSDLHKKSQKLEDALAAAKKLTSQRHSMLLQLRACFIRAQDFAERLKSSEQELQIHKEKLLSKA
ncbi:hypothetical protein MUK42_17717 [Musa troglodytarum]|uniref:Uncharacterized protein n=1 Tax=Musa troglodytarum TaxID=320322 RepID=A0A9E7KEI4_9LILI|nr:hypothetical protein MUK42_17717 [Musa troglodytarum]